jgi:hypothetical protein
MTSKPQPKIPATLPWKWGEGYCTDVYIEYQTPEKVRKLVLLNSMVLPKRPMVIVSSPTDLENVKSLVSISEKIESYIGHESTARLLSELLSIEVPVNRGEYVPQKGDIAIVVRLKKRLQTPQDVKEVKPEDLEFHIIVYEDDRVREEPPTFIIYTLPSTL